MKISVFDWVILSLLFILGVVFFFFFYRSAAYIDIRVKVTDQDILYEYSRPSSQYTDHFVVGDVELDSLGKVISEITNIERFPVDNNRNILYIDLKVKATYDSRTKLYQSRGQKIVYGAPIRFSLSKVTFDGYIIDFPGRETSSEVLSKNITFVVRSRLIEKEVAQSISSGNKVTTSSGETILVIDTVGLTAAELVTEDSQGYPHLRYHPYLKDVLVTITANVTKIGNTYYLYDDIPLVIGNYQTFVVENKIIRDAYILSMEEN